MTAALLTLVGIIVTAAGALVGTMWTKRKGGPEFTSTVLDSMQAHLERLDTELAETKLKLAEAEAAQAVQAQRSAMERIYVTQLVQLLRASGIEVPPRPADPGGTTPTTPFI